MKRGDLVRLSNRGTPVRIVPDDTSRRGRDVPSGTLAVVLETFLEGEIDGTTWYRDARVMVDDYVGFVWLYECEVVNEAR
jgi:hypothetical protein